VEPAGNRRVLGLALGAFSLGFGIWAMFSALGPFLIKWYGFSPGQVMFLAAVEPLGAMLLSIPLGIATDRYGGRIVFSSLLLLLSVALSAGLFVEGYEAFLVLGVVLGLGGASFVVGNAHVSAWYPRSRQGTALGIFALGNVGVVLGMALVPLLVTRVLGGPSGYGALPPKVALGPIVGWHLIFLPFAVASLVMAALYWAFTSEPPARSRTTSLREIAAVYRSSRLAWIIAYLYWVSFGTLTFFAASMPTYLSHRWGVGEVRASVLFTSLLVVCISGMRPLGGWLADRGDPLRILTVLFGAGRWRPRFLRWRSLSRSSSLPCTHWHWSPARRPPVW
jgi:NNP family nitrate/nitrite transporter-like MFS transporter